MFCRKCGTVLPEDSTFCTKCGTEVQETPVSPAQNEQPPQAHPSIMIKKIDRKVWILIGVCVAVALLITIIVFSAKESARCKYGDCPNEHQYNSRYCWQHQCYYTDCDNAKSYNGYYCYTHTCDESDCTEMIYNNTVYCSEHQKYSASNPIPFGRAQKVIQDELEDNALFMLQIKRGANSIKHFEIASITHVSDGDSEPPYSFVVKGSFFAYDAYGSLLGVRKYSVNVSVYSDGKLNISTPTVTD